MRRGAPGAFSGAAALPLLAAGDNRSLAEYSRETRRLKFAKTSGYGRARAAAEMAPEHEPFRDYRDSAEGKKKARELLEYTHDSYLGYGGSAGGYRNGGGGGGGRGGRGGGQSHTYRQSYQPRPSVGGAGGGGGSGYRGNGQYQRY